MANDPMKQFEIKEIFSGPHVGPFDLSFTNSSLWMVIGSVAIIGFLALTARGKLVPGRLQSLGELSYEFIANMAVSYTHLTLPTILLV